MNGKYPIFHNNEINCTHTYVVTIQLAPLVTQYLKHRALGLYLAAAIFKNIDIRQTEREIKKSSNVFPEVQTKV